MHYGLKRGMICALICVFLLSLAVVVSAEILIPIQGKLTDKTLSPAGPLNCSTGCIDVYVSDQQLSGIGQIQAATYNVEDLNVNSEGFFYAEITIPDTSNITTTTALYLYLIKDDTDILVDGKKFYMAGGSDATLQKLSCNAGESPVWDGAQWGCAQISGGSGIPTQIIVSNINTSGQISHNARDGYHGANSICEQALAGSRICTPDDVIKFIAQSGPSALPDPAVYINGAWVANGPPGFTADSNDCRGYSSADSTHLGAFWIFDQNTGGRAALANCNAQKPVACCN